MPRPGSAGILPGTCLAHSSCAGAARQTFRRRPSAPLVPEGPGKIAGGKLALGERSPRTGSPEWASALEGRRRKHADAGFGLALVSPRCSRALPGRKIHPPAHPGAALAGSLAPGYYPLSLRDKGNLGATR